MIVPLLLPGVWLRVKARIEKSHLLRRILIVDDEQIIADTLSLILNQSGFDARAVHSGETALVMARALKPEVLISDVLMSGMTGIELAIQVEKELPDCRIFLYSGQSVTTDLLQTVQTGGHQFEMLGKPLHPQVLIDRLAALFEKT